MDKEILIEYLDERMEHLEEVRNLYSKYEDKLALSIALCELKTLKNLVTATNFS